VYAGQQLCPPHIIEKVAGRDHHIGHIVMELFTFSLSFDFAV